MTKSDNDFDPAGAMRDPNREAVPSNANVTAASPRRRFIRLGASAVPVAMTLASRPVMAWHCNSTSAWGSAQLAGNVGSAKTRLDNTVTNGNECWKISNWKNNDTSGSNMSSAPWNVVKTALGVSSVNDAKNALKVNQIFTSLSGYAGTTKVWDIVNGGAGWAQSVTVARLNTVYATSYQTQINACVVSNATGPNGGDQILRMASLGPGQYFSPNSPTYKWTDADITGYLSTNWLARA